MSIDEMIAVLQAAKEGKRIQWKNAGGVWHNSPALWNFANTDYRVAPEPREWWGYCITGGVPVLFRTESEAFYAAENLLGAEIIHLGELR